MTKIHRGIDQSRNHESLPPLDASPAFPAMRPATHVTGPRLRIINPQLVPAPGDIRLGHRDKWPDQLDPRISPKPDRIPHRLHELLPAVRIDRVIPRMRRDDHPGSLNALRESRGNTQHDAIS